jgi:hypothetical protein
MRQELERFVGSLAIPADRKATVLAELCDHVACAEDAAVREGRDPAVAGREALGNLDALRRSLEAIEPAFGVTRGCAMLRGVVGGIAIAVLLDQGGDWMRGVIGALLAIGIAVVFTPPRYLDLLRAELRTRGLPIGPAITYLFTVTSAPFVVWIALIVKRAFGGQLHADVPWSAFAVIFGMYGLLLVEGVRARLARAAKA